MRCRLFLEVLILISSYFNFIEAATLNTITVGDTTAKEFYNNSVHPDLRTSDNDEDDDEDEDEIPFEVEDGISFETW